MTIVEFIHFLEPVLQVLGALTLILLAAAGILYLLKIFIKPILITAACVSLLSLVYVFVTTWHG